MHTSIYKHEDTHNLSLDDWLTVQHRSITLVNFQLDAQNSYTIHLLKSFTGFETYAAHLQEV
jgi:hypothetical protein